MFIGPSGWSQEEESTVLSPTTVPPDTSLAPTGLLKLLKCSYRSEMPCTGSVFFLDITSDGHLVPLRCFTWTQGLYDVTWSEFTDSVAVTCSADGSLQVWDVKANYQVPVKSVKEHTKEVAGVDWSQDRRMSLVLSASWDTTVKLWDMSRDSSLVTFHGHTNIVYNAVWSPHIPGCFASTSGDGTLRIWDIRKPDSATPTIPVHSSDILTCDWSKYDKVWSLISTL
ncbi:Peroxisomal targeting signal 2 receptor [Lamellibrachia satsuma]|nr:Peroxisomal targeting signal 2 receptor [Lamellibrachia satsuma]